MLIGLKPPQWITAKEIRERFNRGNYLAQAATGEFTCCHRSEQQAASPNESEGTRSIIVGYLDRSGQRIFAVHIYLRPDGRYGGHIAPGFTEGRPDPKFLVEDGIPYRIRESERTD